MKRELWMSTMNAYGTPAWPCPTCKKGTLSLVKDSLVFHETVASKNSRQDEDWDAHWIDYRFTAWAVCSQSACKQMVAISGTGGITEIMTDEGWEFQDSFEPNIWLPMPDLFEIPPKCPKEVREELEAAFALHALQRAACATRLRVALECLMDYVGIPRRKKNASGKFVDQTLHARLERYAQRTAAIGAQLMALKWLGNAGSHDSEVGRNDLLDAMEIFEHALIEIIDERSSRVGKLAKQLSKKFSR